MGTGKHANCAQSTAPHTIPTGAQPGTAVSDATVRGKISLGSCWILGTIKYGERMVANVTDAEETSPHFWQCFNPNVVDRSANE